MQYPNLKEEKRLWKKGYLFVACIDEAGRGPLAGPVVAAAVVILPKSGKLNFIKKTSKNLIKLSFTGLRDSKKLSPKRREEIYRIIMKHPAIQWGIGMVSEKVIDRINIYQATKLAMERALRQLQAKLSKATYITKSCYSKERLYIDYLILDGNMTLDVSIPQKAIVKGDEKVFSCALASIIAKVTRDRMMVRYHKKYPQYGFDRHKGYGTAFHMAMIKKYGPCSIHRMSFNPLAELLKA
ncbi:MAG: ribonuclease HII [bacterium]|nr:ribonuclease HII [bacterium]